MIKKIVKRVWCIPGIPWAMVWLTLCAARWPSLIYNESLNLDEELIAAAVITAQKYGITPWVTVDATTIGPATIWTAYLSHLLSKWAGTGGLEGAFTYRNMHVLAAMLWATGGTMAIATAKVIAGRVAACAALILSLVISAMTLRPDYLHLNSSMVPSVTLAAAGLTVCLQVKKAQWNNWKVHVVTGALLALSILGKLQMSPVVVWIGLCAGVLALAGTGKHEKTKYRLARCAGLLAGIAAIPCILIMVLWTKGEVASAMTYYLWAPVEYAGIRAWDGSRINGIIHYITVGGIVIPPVLIALGVTLLSCRTSRVTNLGARERALWIITVGWLLTAVIAGVMPSMIFAHHETVCVVPGTVSVAILATWAGGGKRAVWKRVVTVGVLLLVFLAAATRALTAVDLGWIKNAASLSPEYVKTFRHIKKIAAGEPIAVWGWAPNIFVKAGSPSATRHIISHLMLGTRCGNEYLKSYLKDIEKNKPKIIVDTVCEGYFVGHGQTAPNQRPGEGGWWGPAESARAEANPEMREFLKKNYTKHEMSPGATAVYTLR